MRIFDWSVLRGKWNNLIVYSWTSSWRGRGRRADWWGDRWTCERIVREIHAWSKTRGKVIGNFWLGCWVTWRNY